MTIKNTSILLPIIIFINVNDNSNGKMELLRQLIFEWTIDEAYYVL